jgi:anti-anti-sigma factor
VTPDEALPGGGESGNRIAVTHASTVLAVVELIGEHDLGEYETLKEALGRAAARHPSLLVDLSRCAFIDSTAISLLLHAYGDLAASGGRFALVIPTEPGPVARVAQIVSLAELVPVYASRDAALAGLEQRAEPQLLG